MYISIYYDLTIPKDLENNNVQIKVKNINSVIFPQKRYAIGYSYYKYNISNYFKHKKCILLITEWAYSINVCIIKKYNYGEVINNKIEKYSALDTVIRNAIKELRKNKSFKYDKSIDLSKMIPEYILYVKNKTNKICKFNEPIYEITKTGIITKEYLIYDRMIYKFWEKVNNRFEFLIGTNISNIEKHKQLFSPEYYSFAKPKTNQKKERENESLS